MTGGKRLNASEHAALLQSIPTGDLTLLSMVVLRWQSSEQFYFSSRICFRCAGAREGACTLAFAGPDLRSSCLPHRARINRRRLIRPRTRSGSRPITCSVCSSATGHYAGQPIGFPADQHRAQAARLPRRACSKTAPTSFRLEHIPRPHRDERCAPHAINLGHAAKAPRRSEHRRAAFPIRDAGRCARRGPTCAFVARRRWLWRSTDLAQ